MAKLLRNDPDQRMSNVVASANLGDHPLDIFDLSQLDREQFPFWIDELRQAETNARRLRTQLEAVISESDRRCPVCDTPVTGRADQVYCGATCRQRARRAGA